LQSLGSSDNDQPRLHAGEEKKDQQSGWLAHGCHAGQTDGNKQASEDMYRVSDKEKQGIRRERSPAKILKTSPRDGKKEIGGKEGGRLAMKKVIN